MMKSVQEPQLTCDQAYAKAVEHFSAGRNSEADQLCTAIIKAIPNHVDAINLLGVIAQKVNRHDLAVQQFKQAIEINPGWVMLYYNLGISLHRLGRIDEAVKIMRTALEKDPGNSQISEYLQRILDNNESTQSIGRSESQYALQRGVDSHQSGRLDDAVNWYRKTLAIEPENVIALSNIGSILKNQGKLEEAVANLKKAVAIQPDFADAFFNLGNAQKELGRLDEAVNCFKKTVLLKPDNADAYYNLGLVLTAQDRVEEAVASYRQVISIDPGYAEAHNNLGNVLNSLDRAEEAVACFKKATFIKSDFTEAFCNLGITLQEQGRVDEAVGCFQKAVALKPGYAEAQDSLGTAITKRVSDYISSMESSDDDRILDAKELVVKESGSEDLKVNLLFCPFVDPVTPPLGIASLKAYLEKYGSSQVRCIDLNIEWHTKLAAEKQDGMELFWSGEQLFNSSDNMFSDVGKYINISSGFISLLHATHKNIQYSLCHQESSHPESIITYLKSMAMDGNPDVIGFSILFNNQILCSLLLAREIKKADPKKIIVFGGAGILGSYRQIAENPFVDFVIMDAGEAPLLDLLNSIKAGKFSETIPGVTYKQSATPIKNPALPADLDNNAFPDFSDFHLDKYFTSSVVIPTLSSKGCFWRRCSFCEEGSLNLYSVAPINRVVDEIEYHYSRGQQYFQFVDEMISAKRLKMLSEEIIRRELKVFFYATLRPSRDFSADTLEIMFQAGFRYIIWGVESCNQRVLKLVNKGTTVESIHSTLLKSENAGIRNHIFVIIGFPSETPEELFETMQFIHDNQEYIHSVNLSRFGLCEGTEIFLNPDKFDIEIEHSKVDVKDYRVKHKSGTTGDKVSEYFVYYQQTFLEKISTVPTFVVLRDHALVYYANVPLEADKKVRKKAPQPVPAHIY
ncbi:MAG: tetratricopeptide repeat protein [Magnetococcales bacterium]|nr:tetratricopeptide repeat protein [Magnetococcales bacterium]